MMPRRREVDVYDIDDEMWMDRRILPLMDVDMPRFRTLDGGLDDHMGRNRS